MHECRSVIVTIADQQYSMVQCVTAEWWVEYTLKVELKPAVLSKKNNKNETS